MRHFGKLTSVLLICCLAFSAFCFTASAESSEDYLELFGSGGASTSSQYTVRFKSNETVKDVYGLQLSFVLPTGFTVSDVQKAAPVSDWELNYSPERQEVLLYSLDKEKLPFNNNICDILDITIDKELSIGAGAYTGKFNVIDVTYDDELLSLEPFEEDFEINVVDCANHSFSWIVTEEASCSVTGEKQYKCPNCNTVLETEVIARLPHTYSQEYSVITYPAADSTGLIAKKCENCDAYEPGSETELEYAKFDGAYLVLQNDLSIGFLVENSIFEKYDSVKVKFNFGGKETVVTEYTQYGDDVAYTFSNLNPTQIGKTVTAQIIGTKQGFEIPLNSVDYSVSNYCYNMLGKTEDSKLRTLLVDLLNYGSACQDFTSDPSPRVNANLTSLQKTYGTSYVRGFKDNLVLNKKVIASPQCAWDNASLVLGANIEVKFTLDTVPANAVVKITDTKGNVLATLTPNGNEVIYAGLSAGQMSKLIYATVYVGDTAVSNTIQYSIESYAARKAYDTVTKLSGLVKAMILYGDSAALYANK